MMSMDLLRSLIHLLCAHLLLFFCFLLLEDLAALIGLFGYGWVAGIV